MSDFKTLIELVEKDGKLYSKVINQFAVNPLIASGMCYVLYNTLIDCIPEEKQIDFEKLFLAYLDEMIKAGHQHMEYYKND